MKAQIFGARPVDSSREVARAISRDWLKSYARCIARFDLIPKIDNSQLVVSDDSAVNVSRETEED